MTHPSLPSTGQMYYAALGALVARDWPRILRLITLQSDLMNCHIDGLTSAIDMMIDQTAQDQADLVEIYLPAALKSDNPENVSSILPSELPALTAQAAFDSCLTYLAEVLTENADLRRQITAIKLGDDGLTIPPRPPRAQTIPFSPSINRDMNAIDKAMCSLNKAANIVEGIQNELW